MPFTKLTEDTIKDVAEGLLEELESEVSEGDYKIIAQHVRKAAYSLWDKYRGNPFMKLVLFNKNGQEEVKILTQKDLDTHNKITSYNTTDNTQVEPIDLPSTENT